MDPQVKGISMREDQVHWADVEGKREAAEAAAAMAPQTSGTATRRCSDTDSTRHTPPPATLTSTSNNSWKNTSFAFPESLSRKVLPEFPTDSFPAPLPSPRHR